jgi:hypothetical protein
MRHHTALQKMTTVHQVLHGPDTWERVCSHKNHSHDIFNLHLNPLDSKGNPHAAVQIDEVIMCLVLFQSGAEI